jgi:hypothetical protein
MHREAGQRVGVGQRGWVEIANVRHAIQMGGSQKLKIQLRTSKKWQT